jgi:hypothetical protein
VDLLHGNGKAQWFSYCSATSMPSHWSSISDSRMVSWLSLREIQDLSWYSSLLFQRYLCKRLNSSNWKRQVDVPGPYCFSLQQSNLPETIAVSACNIIDFMPAHGFADAIEPCLPMAQFLP